MAVLHPQMYYFAAQLQHFMGWDLETTTDPSRNLLIGPDTAYTTLSHMVMGLPKITFNCPTAQLLMKVWKGVKNTLG